MLMKFLCPPAIVYIVFTSIHALVSVFENDVKGAFLQVLIGILIVLLLQFLCLNGLGLISWVIVFLPFILYTYMTVLLYNVFVLNKPKKTMKDEEDNISLKDSNRN